MLNFTSHSSSKILMLRLAFGVGFFLCLTSCSLFIGTLPKPDPIWKAAVGFGPHDAKGCLVILGQPPDCLTSHERVMRYLSTFFPSTPQNFSLALQEIGFECEPNEQAWSCSYSKSQAPEPCVGSIRVSIKIHFSQESPIIEKEKIILRMAADKDPDGPDNRGCFPL